MPIQKISRQPRPASLRAARGATGSASAFPAVPCTSRRRQPLCDAFCLIDRRCWRRIQEPATGHGRNARGTQPPRPNRRGGATLELAIVLPLMLLIFFGTIDALGMMFVKQSLSLAAYEATRLASNDDVTSEDVAAACHKLLAERGVHNAVVRTIPAEIKDVPPGEMVQVEVQVSFDDADLYFARLHEGRLATLSFTAMKRGIKEQPPTALVEELLDVDLDVDLDLGLDLL